MRGLILFSASLAAALFVDADAAVAAGLPQLDPSTYSPQLVWLAVTFLILYLLMARIALPRIAHVLEERQDRIDDNLERATTLKAESDQSAAAYEASVAESRARAQGVIGEASLALANDAAARQEELGKTLAAHIEEAEAGISEAKQGAIGNIRDVARDVAKQAVEALAGEAVDEAQVAAAVDAAAKGNR
jgi:F-type H+-transporting ATPase subunit b